MFPGILLLHFLSEQPPCCLHPNRLWLWGVKQTNKKKSLTYLHGLFIFIFHCLLQSNIALGEFERANSVIWWIEIPPWHFEKNKYNIEPFCFVFLLFCCCCFCFLFFFNYCCCFCCCCCLLFFENAVNPISAYSEVTCCSNLDLFAKTSPVLINFRRSTYQVLALWPKLTVIG